MKALDSKWRLVAIIAAGVAASSGAHAYWTFGTTTATPLPIADKDASNTTVSAITVTNITGAYAANGGTLTTSGAAIVPAGTACGNCGTNNTYGINGFASGATWTVNANSTPVYYSSNGYGMASDGTVAPDHALDNGPSTDNSGNIKTQANGGLGNTEALLLSFSSSVVLNAIDIGYKSGDADISLFRYTGASAPSLNLTDPTKMTTTGGWELIGTMPNLTSDNTVPFTMNSVNSASKGSSWWLVSAYNSAWGTGTGLDQGNDFFKVLAVGGTACTSQTAGQCGPSPGPGVPEPASLALVGVALLGATTARRRAVRK